MVLSRCWYRILTFPRGNRARDAIIPPLSGVQTQRWSALAVTVRGNLLAGAVTGPCLLIAGSSSPWAAPALTALSVFAYGSCVVYRRVWQH